MRSIANNPFPIDCAVAKSKDNEYPWKINHNFHEMFCVLEGECFIEFGDETVHLKKQDVHIIEPGRTHTTRAEYADILIACTPPLDIKNVEFLGRDGDKLEKMDDFFTVRLNKYDENMLNIEELPEAYRQLARLIPANTKTLLDLGCGTGLELEEIFKLHPNIVVTGIDLTRSMIGRLREKYPENITLFYANYLAFDFGIEKYDIAISVETMHHLSYKEKLDLYSNIFKTIKPSGQYIECDYMIDTQEEEVAENSKLRAEQNIFDGELYHYDTPLTIKNQIKLFLQAGFTNAEKVWRKNDTAIIVAKKK